MCTSTFAEKLRAIGIAILVNALTLAMLTFFLGTATFPNGGKTVYITNTGECYHLSGCSSLSHSKYETTVREAVRSGYFSCSNCDSPVLMGEDGTLFSRIHYLLVVPVAALWTHIACMEILYLDPKHPILLYGIHLGIGIGISFIFDAIF